MLVTIDQKNYENWPHRKHKHPHYWNTIMTSHLGTVSEVRTIVSRMLTNCDFWHAWSCPLSLNAAGKLWFSCFMNSRRSHSSDWQDINSWEKRWWVLINSAALGCAMFFVSSVRRSADSSWNGFPNSLNVENSFELCQWRIFETEWSAHNGWHLHWHSWPCR